MQRRHRLRSTAAIQALWRRGRRQGHPLAVLVYQPNDQPLSRFGFSASRQIGRAVARNRAKRLLREAVRRHLAAIRPGYDCLFVARQPAPGASLVEVETAVYQLLRRAGLWQDDAPAPSQTPD